MPPRLSRRSFVGYVVGGTTLMVAADLTVGVDPAQALPIPSVPQVPELYDLNDFLSHCALPTSGLIGITLDAQGDAHFALPRMEVGQGITTAIAMLIADEPGPADRARARHAGSGPPGACSSTRLTGGSNTIVSMYTPVRVAAAVARKALLDAAAIRTRSARGHAGHQGRRDHRARRDVGVVRRRGERRRRTEHHQGAGPAQDRLRAHPGRYAAAPDRRARRRDRAQEVRDGPRRPRRAADDGLPRSRAQRHRPLGAQPGRGRRDAGRHPRRDHPHRRGRAGAYLRAVHRRGAGARRGVERRDGAGQERRRHPARACAAPSPARRPPA
ncbi:hypothetical protein [Nocardioides convexus]|uniref:hypothetical protein n=1 Tax=Nocardioides convexus TaxID=2712224 RepID=UPI0024183C26|nr:hypothetical protein [Nocardioides convexus]